MKSGVISLSIRGSGSLHNHLVLIKRRRFNLSLGEYINIRFVSITETCIHASRIHLSTLAVLQLDAILTYAKEVGEVPAKSNGNQKPFDKMMVMRYDCPGIGLVKMTVGVRRGNQELQQNKKSADCSAGFCGAGNKCIFATDYRPNFC